jgi:hypothetical protein
MGAVNASPTGHPPRNRVRSALALIPAAAASVRIISLAPTEIFIVPLRLINRARDQR